ncbi:RidA family protein [Methylobacterium sp. CM6246]
MNAMILARLAAAGLALQRPTMPAANYVPFARAGSLLFVAGQTPVQDGIPRYLGIVGEDVTVEDAQAAARLCALNILAQVGVALGNEPRRVRCLRLGGFVRSRDAFTQQARVMDGASDRQKCNERRRHSQDEIHVNGPAWQPAQLMSAMGKRPRLLE